MAHYVKHMAMKQAFSVLVEETNPIARSALLDAVTEDFLTQYEEQMERTAYELRQQDWTLAMIADELCIGQDRVKTLVANHARRIRRKNPIRSGRDTKNVVNISHLVRRRKRIRRKG